jgi:hypothetical protein
MNVPEGMSYDSKHGLSLTKTIYGLVQSARELYKKLMSTLKFIEFKGSKQSVSAIEIESKWSHHD